MTPFRCRYPSKKAAHTPRKNCTYTRKKPDKYSYKSAYTPQGTTDVPHEAADTPHEAARTAHASADHKSVNTHIVCSWMHADFACGHF